MTGYLDSSALVKQVVPEPGSAETVAFVHSLEQAGTALISRTEVGAALARAARSGRLPLVAARAAYERFLASWEGLVHVEIEKPLLQRAEALSWDHELRAYDAVQLAAALRLQEIAQAPVVMACFDARLRAAAAVAGLEVWP